MDLSEILLITSGLLTLSMVAATLCRHIALPHTVVLVLLGVALNQAASNIPALHLLSEFELTPDLVLFVFLPALIFESALNLDAKALMKDILPILLLAIPGLLLSTAIVGFSLSSFFEVEIMIALLFGALISATDPVAVVALFKELGAPRRLNILVEGESLLNDATAIVLFTILLSLIAAGHFELADTTTALVDFMRVFFGGILVGLVTSVIMSGLMVRLYHGNQSVQIVLSLAMAYIAFILAEHTLHVSGVMAVLVAAIYLNGLGITRLSGATTHAIHETWEFIVLICNSLLFLMIGLSVDIIALAGYWQPILMTVAATLFARALTMYVVLPFAVDWFSLPKISLNERTIMWWGGLKGGLAIAIVLLIPVDMDNRQMLIALTLGVVLFSLIVNASSIKSVMHWLGISELTGDERSEIKHGMDHIQHEVRDLIAEFSKLGLLDHDVRTTVTDALEWSMQDSQEPLSAQQLTRYAYLNVLQVESDELEHLNEIRLTNYYNYLGYCELLYNDKERPVVLQHNKKSKISNSERMEMALINFLIEKDWASKLLTYYQNLRFTNLIQRDIVGILLVNAALKSLDSQREVETNVKIIAQLKERFRRRLKVRQARLNAFADAYPEYCREYKNILFQRVALSFAIKTIKHDLHSGKLGAKAFSQIEEKLKKELKKLPKISSSLLLTKRHDLIENVPLFSGLPKDMLNILATNARYVNFLPEDIIFKQGDRGRSLYIVVNGTVSVFHNSANGDVIPINDLQKGSFFGERALLGNKVRSATVKAKTHVILLRLSAKKINQLAIKLPELKARLGAEDLSRREADLHRQRD